MKPDLYTKAALTVIALLLAVIAYNSIPNSIVRAADQPQRVTLVDAGGNQIPLLVGNPVAGIPVFVVNK